MSALVAPAVAALQAVTLLLRPSLISLVKHWLSQHKTDNAVDLQPLEEQDPRPWEWKRPHCPLMSLPVALGLDGTEALSAQQNSTSYQPSALPRKGKIGVVWAAGHKPDADACTRSEQEVYRLILVSVLNQQLGSLWKGGPIQLINMQHVRSAQKRLTKKIYSRSRTNK